MKKALRWLLCLALALSLAGCGGKTAPETAVKTVVTDGETFAVDTANGTVSDGENVYPYRMDFSGLHITYPDGESYTWRESGGTAVGVTSLNFSADGFADPLTLVNAIYESSGATEKDSHEYAFAGLLLIVIGAVNAVWPKAAWSLKWGWRYRNAEPSALALGLFRAVGIGAVLIGIILLFV